MAMCGRKMSRFPLFWLLLVLGDLLENTSCLERVSRHHLVQVCKLGLMRLRLHEEVLFTLLLCRVYFHHSMEVATLEVAEKQHLMPNEVNHWYESGLVDHTKTANQLVAYIGKTGNSLEVIPDTFVKVCLCTTCIGFDIALR
jgi:hypothetical protein